MRVLIQNRPDTPANPGGDTVQMEESAAFLRSHGHTVDISFERWPNLAGYDVVHLFNLTRPFETLDQARNAVRQKKKYVLSSIYWDLESAVPWHAFEFPRNWARRLLPDALRSAIRTLRGRESTDSMAIHAAQAEILRGAALVFPNSAAEMDHILHNFSNLDPNRFCVVMNGIRPASRESIALDDRIRHLATGAFLCLGAIGPRKNQLNLVRAFRNLPDQRLVIIGQTSVGSADYRRAVERAASANVSFHEPVPHTQVPALWSIAKACVQPSYIETPGLSAMEALAAGLPVVVADVAPVREYFANLAHYCDPASPRSIAEACRTAAAHRPTNPAGFAERYHWDRVLAPMADAYNELARGSAAT